MPDNRNARTRALYKELNKETNAKPQCDCNPAHLEQCSVYGESDSPESDKDFTIYLTPDGRNSGNK